MTEKSQKVPIEVSGAKMSNQKQHHFEKMHDLGFPISINKTFDYGNERLSPEIKKWNSRNSVFSNSN